MDEVTMGEMPSSMRRASVGGKDNSHPVEWIRGVVHSNAIQRNLAAHEEDEQRDDRPENLLAERNATIRLSDFRNHAHGRLDEVKKADHFDQK